jgi:hypothetical protein
MRKKKDLEIRNLEEEKEKQRVKYEEIINRLDIEIKCKNLCHIIIYRTQTTSP